MNTEEISRELEERLSEAEKILVGIGPEWKTGDEAREILVKKAGETLGALLEGKDHYVVSTLSGEEFERLGMKNVHAVTPLDVSLTEEQWNAYTEWLSRTLNRKLVILELGDNFLRPSVMRWPFEKTAELNLKACMFRVHKTFSQIPDELKGKAFPVKADSVEFMASLAADRN